MFTDAHCHLNLKDFAADDISLLLERAKSQNVGLMINVGAGDGFDGNRQAIDLANQYQQIYSSIGMHPHDASLVTPDIIQQIEAWAKNEPKVVSIGEIGLDYFYEHSPKEIQEKVFEQFIEVAKRVGKPIMIHDRGAGDRTYEMLKSSHFPGNKIMIHCFTGSTDLSKKYLDLGCFLSFTGIVTFKKSTELKEIVKTVPIDRLFIETDAPYLAPEPHRGKKNEPSLVPLVAQCIATLKEITLDEVEKQTTQNVLNFFGIPFTFPDG